MAGGVTFNQSYVYALLSWISGFSINTTEDACFALKFLYYSPTQYSVTISVDCDTRLSTIYWRRLFVDVTTMQTKKTQFVDYGWVDGTGSTQSSELNLTYHIQSSFFIAFTSMKLNMVSGSDFLIDRENTCKISTNTGYNYLNFSYFNYHVRTCPTGYTYYRV